MDYYRSQNPYPGPNCTSQLELLSDYLLLEDGSEEDSSSQTMPLMPAKVAGGDDDQFPAVTLTNDGMERKKVDGVRVVAFRTKSEVDVMDDGYKWRKYGKKMVKSSPNPRNYYRCSTGGCQVKKRIERDKEDGSYVITTYEGVHNHPTPSVAYYNQMYSMPPHDWTLQASFHSPFS